MLQALGGRKFLMSVVILAIGTAVAILSPEAMKTPFVVFLLGVLSAFSAGNVVATASHFKNQAAKARQQKVVKETVTKVDNKELDDVKAQIEAISSLQEKTSQAVLDTQQFLNNYVAKQLGQ